MSHYTNLWHHAKHETNKKKQTTGSTPETGPGVVATRPRPKRSRASCGCNSTYCSSVAGAARRGSAKRKPATRAPGRPCYLSAKQVTRLEAALQRGARAYGYADDYWTLARIARVIWKLFGIRYHPSSVWRVLRRMGWSCQKPQRVAFRHDDAAIAHWKHYIWPRIKKVAKTGCHTRI
jgi:transposase